MKEIKFRAWVGDRSLLTKVISYVKHKNGFSISYNDSKGNELALMYSKSHAIKLMQFTGLLDKNGVEIYDGDIVSGIGSCCEVFWHDDLASWRLDVKNLGGYDVSITSDKIIDLKIEVIGNVYEHSHLLGENKKEI